MFRLLLSKGVNVNHTNKEGSSALHAACQKNTGDTGAIVTELLLARIDVSLVDSEVPCRIIVMDRERTRKRTRRLDGSNLQFLLITSLIEMHSTAHSMRDRTPR